MPRHEEDEGAEFGVRTKGRRGSRASKGKGRGRRPVKRGSVNDIVWGGEAERPTTTTAFADPDMQRLYDRGYFDTLVARLRGGKEATVYVVRRGEESLVAKLYTDLELRSFRNDTSYWDGYWVADARAAKAMRRGTRTGLRVKMDVWVLREYRTLWRLHDAGLPVPRPAVGPDVSDLSESGSVVLMQLIGDGEEPAPRLSDLRLPDEEVRSAWDQAAAIYLRLAELGLAHGDLSTYNLLWHEGSVWLIDVPQAVEVAASREGVDLLRRDLDTLATSFRRLGHRADTEELWRRALRAAAPRGM